MDTEIKDLFVRTRTYKGIYTMKVTNEKYERKIHVYARSKGEYADIIFKSNVGRDHVDECFDLDEAKEILKYLTLAIEDLEKRLKMSPDE
jgi:hypothetical protein